MENQLRKEYKIDFASKYKDVFTQKLINQFGQATYDSWFKDIILVEEGTHSLCFAVESRFIKEWITANYYDDFKNILESIKSSLIDLDIIVRPSNISKNKVDLNPVSDNKTDNNTVIDAANSNDDNFKIKLDPKLTFENFIVGDENKLAYSAIKSLLSSNALMGDISNVYLYSNVGLGKSHLLSSFAHELNKLNKKYIYLTSERFVYYYLKSIRESKLLPFKERFNDIEYFLLDDIHFLQNKNSTQQEITNIIENITSNGSKVIFTSDRKLTEFNDFNTKLKSFLSSGIVASINTPSRELRKKIIEHKCKINSYDISKNQIDFMAEQPFSSVREIEGAINKIMVHTNILGEKVTIDALPSIISDFIVKSKGKRIDIDYIVKKISQYFKLSVADIKSKKRKKEIVFARNIAVFLIKKHTKLSLAQIGEFIGKRDHATILHSYNKIDKEQKEDLILKFEIEKIEESFYQSY